MSLITRNNYEAFLLDYVEGTLSPELTAELMLFLEQNPELKEDLADFEIHTLTPTNTVGFDNSTLKKDAEGVDFESLMVAEIEGVNSEENTVLLTTYLKENPKYQKEFDAYQKTILIAPTVLFEDKIILKKKGGVVIPLFWKYSSAAAAIILVLWTLNWPSEDPTYSPLGEKGSFLLDSVDNTNVLEGFIIIEERQIAEELKPVKQNLRKQHNHTNNDKQKKSNISNEKVIDENQLANNVEKAHDIKVDSSEFIHPKDLIEKEEELYAENNVTITYEEEILDDGTPNLQKRKFTKLDILKAVVKHRVSGNLDKGKEKVLLAMNTKPLNFLRKKKKK